VHAAIAWAMTGQSDAELVWAPASVSYMTDVGGDAPVNVIRADPVHLETGADRLTLFPAACTGLKANEARELVATMNESLEQLWGQFVVGDTERWYLTLPESPVCDWIAPECVEGQDVLPFMPRGADGVIINRLINDVQMVLHNHPLNEARRGRGEPEINSIWPWGWCGGTQRPLPQWQGGTIADHPYARGLALLSGSDSRVVTSADIEKPEGHGLIVFQGVETALRLDQEEEVERALMSLEEQIVQPLTAALRRGALDRLQLVTSSGYCHALRKTDLWKFWRRRSQPVSGET
jgi:hypothetical protein